MNALVGNGNGIQMKLLWAAIAALGEVGFGRVRDAHAARGCERRWFRWCKRALP